MMVMVMEMDAPSDRSLSSEEIEVNGQGGETVSIPVDLVMDILTRLPARDVLRSRSVCKEWNSILRTPKFISLHYNRSLRMRHGNAADPSSFIYLRKVPAIPSFLTSIPSFLTYSLDDPTLDSITLTFLTLEETTTGLVAKVDKEEDFIAIVSSLLFPSCPTESDLYNLQYLQMICPFDGLICFGCEQRVIMYNPATRDSRMLPPYPELSNIYDPHILGVWFESAVKQHYKVFTMVRANNCYMILIYDSTADSWRVTETVDGNASYRSGLLLNGVVYFDMTKNSGVQSIVTFDAKLETFGYLEIPSSFANRWHVSLLPFRGNLACMDKYVNMNDGTLKFDLWVMTENGVNQSWTQKFCVPFDCLSGFDMHADECYYGVPIAFLRNKDDQDEVLFKYGGETVSFNINTEKKTNLKISYLPYTDIDIIPYNVESLLSLK